MAKKNKYQNKVSWVPQLVQPVTSRPDKSSPVTWIYGDSFAQLHLDTPTWHTWWALDHSRYVCNRGEAGSGPERAVWLWWKDHSRGLHGAQDRVLICVSEISRMFQSNLQNVNWATALEPPADTDQWRAINQYYRHCYSPTEPIMFIRLQSLLMWLDQQLKSSPAKTMVAYSFPWREHGVHYNISSVLERNLVPHWFANADNLWPSLMYFSVTDPDYRGDIALDPRKGHMSRRQHEFIYQGLQRQTQGDRWLIDRPPGFLPVYRI